MINFPKLPFWSNNNIDAQKRPNLGSLKIAKKHKINYLSIFKMQQKNYK